MAPVLQAKLDCEQKSFPKEVTGSLRKVTAQPVITGDTTTICKAPGTAQPEAEGQTLARARSLQLLSTMRHLTAEKPHMAFSLLARKSGSKLSASYLKNSPRWKGK